MSKKWPTILIFSAVAVLTGTAFYISKNSPEQEAVIVPREILSAQILPLAKNSTAPRPTPSPVPQTPLQLAAYGRFLQLFGGDQPRTQFDLIEPVVGFTERILHKQFGIFITPETSPIQPDKFAGWHTGADAEFIDTGGDISVNAIADGIIVSRTWSSGYGGVVVVKHILNDVPLYALYGHLDPASFPANNIVRVKAGDRLGLLGDGHTHETDGARKHLHFAIYPGEKMDYRGYVKTEEELANWLNPLDFYR